MDLRPKDYIQTEDDLFCAVVSSIIENNCALVTCRYYRDKQNQFHKLEDEAADAFLKRKHPEYIYHSKFADVLMHAVPVGDIKTILRPESGLRRLLQSGANDAKQCDARHCIRLLLDSGVPIERLGITGSLLIDAHNERSDIDLLVYGRDHHLTVREHCKQLLKDGKLSPLSDADWRITYQRRDCELSFDEYYAHEKRKFNKFICKSSKVDISLIPLASECPVDKGPFKKRGFIALSAMVINDRYSYDYPARYTIDYADISEIVSYTSTYIGQAVVGERIAAAGHIEEDAAGKKRLLVGTSRAAKKEYIKIEP